MWTAGAPGQVMSPGTWLSALYRDELRRMELTLRLPNWHDVPDRALPDVAPDRS
jgi:hypothetical protein